MKLNIQLFGGRGASSGSTKKSEGIRTSKKVKGIVIIFVYNSFSVINRFQRFCNKFIMEDLL